MNILYLASLDFYSKPNPSFHLMTSMIEDFLSMGNKVFLVGQSESSVSKHIPPELENNHSFDYVLIKTKTIAKSNFIKRYIHGVNYSKKTSKVIKRIIGDIDIIFVQSSPTVYYSIKALRKITQKPIVYNVQDMFPGSTIACGKMNNKLLQKFFYSLQKKAYQNATIITAISDDMKIKLIEQGVPEDKIRVIVNWYDDDTVCEISRKDNLFIKKNNMDPNKFYVQYAGTMGYVFDYKMIIAVAELLKHHSNIVFQMIGIGSQKKIFERQAYEKGLTNIVFLPLEPQQMVSHVYSACDVCLIPLKKGVIGNSVPSKAGLVMACKRPIITTADPNSIYCKSINDNDIGFAYGTDDCKLVSEAIIYLSENKSAANQMGLNGYYYGRELYSRKANTRKYLQLFLDILKLGELND